MFNILDEFKKNVSFMLDIKYTLDALDCLVNIEELNSLLITDEFADLIDYLWKINHYAILGQINKYDRNSFRNICETIKNITIKDDINE